MPPDPPREQGPPGLATPTQINATPTSKTVENPDLIFSLYIYVGLSVSRMKSYIVECLHMFEPSITHNLITCVLTFYLV